MIEYTVSQIVRKLKDIVENDNDLIGCQVKGEVTNLPDLTDYKYRHLYFSIKDESSCIPCVIFNFAKILNTPLENGDKVIIKATPTIYNVSGKLQLNITSIKKDGVGDLLQKYEELKKKLTEQGYFDEDHKKTLEILYPSSIGVVVGDASAAMSDIKRTFARRWPLCEVVYYPSIVQGDTAPADLVKKIKEADSNNHDAIIVARGGGSFEDLFCFNDENLVKTIYNAKTFIVSGVGHEQDFTLCDFVADLRASTPTAAVDLLTPDIEEVIERVCNLKEEINNAITSKLDNLYQFVDNSLIKLNYFSKKIENIDNQISINRKQLSNLLNNKIDNYNRILLPFKNQLNININHKLSIIEQGLQSKLKIITAYSQENILKRGYSIVYKNNKIINSSKDLKEDDLVKIRLHQSEVKAIIKEA